MSGFQLHRLGMLMEPEAGNPQEIEGVLNPAAARGHSFGKNGNLRRSCKQCRPHEFPTNEQRTHPQNPLECRRSDLAIRATREIRRREIPASVRLAPQTPTLCLARLHPLKPGGTLPPKRLRKSVRRREFARKPDAPNHGVCLASENQATSGPVSKMTAFIDQSH